MFYKVLLAVLGLCVAFNMKCPETAQWSNRARLHCPDPSLYYCLLSIDGNSRINVENCSRVDFEAPGKRIVIRWNIDAFYCTNDKYQPIKYWTNVSTDCIFLTSTCSEEGQVLNSVDRYHEYDTSCRCDYSKGYDFVTRPNNPSLCIPSEEDCSCYKKRCAIINSTLSRDQKDVVDISTVFPITSVATYKDIFLELPEINNTDNIGKGNYWNTPAAIVVSVILIISTCICVVLLCCENQIEGIDQFGGKENPKTTLDENDKRSYLNNIKLLTETRYLIRIIIIGENGVGKTCLLRRLLKREILGVDSTDGIDIHSCKIQKDDGKWIIDKEIDKKKELIVRLKRCMQNAQKPKDDSTIDKGNDQTLEETPSSSTQFEMGNAKNEHKSAVERTLDNSTLEPEINKFKDVNLEKKSNTSHSVLTTSTQPNKAEKQQVHENQISNILNNTILQDISGFLDEMENSKISDEVLVDCRFWDFAGQPEYYPTHPIFINPRALHLLVAKMTNEKDYEQQIKVDKGFKHIGEYLDFWFDSVHSLTYFQTKAENTQDKLDPPVILVGTNIDKFGDSEDLAERTETFRRKVIKLVGEEKQKHLRGIYAVSNTKSNEKTIDGLRKLIFEVGKKMKTFGEMLPLKFIRLERALDIVREADVNILSWSDITKLGYTCSFDNEYEINKFLIYQHEIGNIIYFEKLNETIILNQQWLADAFRCLVSAKYDNDVTITPEWIALENTGKLADVLVTKLLKKKSQFIRSEHRNHILKVMEMFGIIFKITTLTSNGGTETSPTYYMPCMIKESTSIEDIKEQFCVYEIQKCTQSPWLCIEFEFMPLDIFNNIMREFISTYYVCTEPKNQRMAIYYGLGVFLPWGSEFQKLVVYFCKNTIALQIWQWEEKIENKKYKEIVDLMQLWIDRYQTKYEKRKLIYTLKTKCSDEDIHSVGGRKSFEDLERCEKYMCTHEQNIEYHRSSDFLQTWFYRFKETPFDAGVHQHDQYVKSVFELGTYESFENRIYLAGACSVGKSTLASLLIGDEIPLEWKSTDGLKVFFGSNGIHLEERKMVPLNRNKGNTNIPSNILRGHPEESSSRSKLANNGTSLQQSIHVSTDMERIQGEHPLSQPLMSYVSEKQGAISEKVQANKKPIQKRLGISSIHEGIKQEIKKGDYKVKIAPSDLVDFGGQKSYDMTHQLFIQGKGTFNLLFDGRKGLHDPLPEYPQGNVTAALILKHWVDSILTYCGEDDDDILPVILFVATHRDTLTEDEQTKMMIEFQKDLKDMFQNHERANRIKYNDIYFINGTNRNDPEVIRLQTTYVDIAFRQKSWGKRMPMAWVPLELQLSEMRAGHISIIAKDDLIKINEENDDLKLTDKQLDEFLRVQHVLGKIMYFKSQGLENFIIVQPTSLVDILRAFITDEMFFPDDTTLRQILNEMTKSGKIRKEDLFKLWQQDEFNRHMPDDNFKEFVVQVLIHLDLLIEPKRYNTRGKAGDVYLVPCIIKEEITTNLCENLEESKTLYLSYKLLKSSIPSALSFKIIGSALNVWPLKKTDTGGVCLYNKAAILSIDQSNELYILARDKRVVVCLHNKESRQFISPDIASCIQECLTLTIENAFKFYHSSFGKMGSTLEITNLFNIEVGEKCNAGICYLPLPAANKVPSWKCRNGKEHGTKYPLYWTFDKVQVCKPDCTGLDQEAFKLCPDYKHLARLALSIGISKFRDFVIRIGLSTDDWEAFEYKHQGRNVNMMRIDALCAWKNGMDQPTFQDLHDAISGIGYNCHILCQIFREDRTIYDIDHPLLWTVPENDTLHELSKNIGTCAIRLGIELNVPDTEIEQTTTRYSKDIFQQNYDILLKWKNKYGKTNGTIRTLMHVLHAVDKRGCKFLGKQYKIKY